MFVVYFVSVVCVDLLCVLFRCLLLWFFVCYLILGGFDLMIFAPCALCRFVLWVCDCLILFIDTCFAVFVECLVYFVSVLGLFSFWCSVYVRLVYYLILFLLILVFVMFLLVA